MDKSTQKGSPGRHIQKPNYHPNDDDRVPLLDELLETAEKDRDIVAMKPDRRLVEKVKNPFAFLADEVIGQLDSLEFAAQ